jgi:hypothetical protein
MGLKWLFVTMFSVLAHPEAFWKEQRERHPELNAMKDYAAPVIAIAQLFKIPLIGVPRSAMIVAMVNFTVDVAVLYLLSGAIVSLVGRQRPQSFQDDVLTMFCYALTPVWLVEPFYFMGSWRWLFFAVALLHSIFISRYGLQSLLGREVPNMASLFGKSAVIVAMATMTAFMLNSGLIRFFTSF